MQCSTFPLHIFNDIRYLRDVISFKLYKPKITRPSHDSNENTFDLINLSLAQYYAGFVSTF